MRLQKNADDFGLPSTQDASHKWRFRLGFPTKHGIFLVVTGILGGGDNPTDDTIDDTSSYKWGEKTKPYKWRLTNE